MSAAALLAARVALAAVFAVAAIGKLRDRDGARRAVEEFGAPRRLAPRLATAIVAGELAAVALLLVTPAARAGAALVLVLLAVFSAAVAISLARGRAPECHCFGRLHSEPAGGGMLARNAGLAGVALAVLLSGPGTGSGEALAALGGSDSALVAALAVALLAAASAAVLLVQVLDGQRRLVARVEDLQRTLVGLPDADEPEPEGLPVGAPAPELALPDADGATVTLEAMRREGRPLLVVLTDPRCGPCRALLPAVAAWQRDLADCLTVVAVSAGNAGDVRGERDEHGLERVLVDPAGEALRAFAAGGTPSAVLVHADGTIASPVAAGSAAIGRLADEASGAILRVAQVAQA